MVVLAGTVTSGLMVPRGNTEVLHSLVTALGRRVSAPVFLKAPK